MSAGRIFTTEHTENTERGGNLGLAAEGRGIRCKGGPAWLRCYPGSGLYAVTISEASKCGRNSRCT